MEARVKKLKKINWILFFIFLFLLVLMSLFDSCKFYKSRVVNNFAYPYLSLNRSVQNSVAKNSQYLTKSKYDLIAEITALEEINRNLATQAILIHELEEQNKILREQNKLPKFKNFRCINGEIILRNPTDWFESFTINRGGRNGITTGAAVFTLDNNFQPILLGIVEEVFDHSSRVLSISSLNLKISATLSKSKNVGLINFNETRYRKNNQYVTIDLLPNNANYVIEEPVYTTGLEENIPSGIKIGNLAVIDKDTSNFSNQLYISGLIATTNNFANTKFISVAIKDTL